MVRPGYSPFLEEALVLVHNPSDDTLKASHGRVHAQHDQHEEEDHRPERFKYTFGPAHVRRSLNEKQISLNSCPSLRQKIDHSQTGLTKTDCQAGLLQPVDRLQTPVQGLVEDINM